jgi:hypothetical protein
MRIQIICATLLLAFWRCNPRQMLKNHRRDVHPELCLFPVPPGVLMCGCTGL